MKKKLIASMAMAAAAVMVPAGIILAGNPFTDASKISGSGDWEAYKEDWNSIANDYTKLSIQPGADESQLNFAWYTEKADNNEATVYMGTDRDNLAKFTGSIQDVDKSLTGGTPYVANHVTVTGLVPGHTYYYKIVKNGAESEINPYFFSKTDKVKFLLVGDPQIGASKGQEQDGEKLSQNAGAADSAARNDSYSWNRTLSIASRYNSDLDFIVSAGDQVNNTGKPKEEQYAGFLNSPVLRNIPLAATIGNHDSLNEDFKDHFYVPNATANGETKAGGDYYYSYGDGLFIVLNTNNYNAAEHEATIKQAIASDPDAVWRIVTIHQDIYGSGKDHSDTDGMILRTQLTPIFDANGIDVVLQGHDHTYSRSKLLYGDGQTHGKYQFNLNADGSDYDWNHAYNVENGSAIALSPADGDTAGRQALDNFHHDNDCYSIDDFGNTNSVVNPKGILYITANSATGSKYYSLISTQQDYVAVRSQNWLPSYSVCTMDSKNFTITTYQITDEGKVEKLDDTFTIMKK